MMMMTMMAASILVPALLLLHPLEPVAGFAFAPTSSPSSSPLLLSSSLSSASCSPGRSIRGWSLQTNHDDDLGKKNARRRRRRQSNFSSSPSSSSFTATTATQLYALIDEEEEDEEEQRRRQLQLLQEESRIQIWSDRRQTIRFVLKAAESTKNFRRSALSPSEDDNLIDDPEAGTTSFDDGGKSALAITAFVVAGGAVLLRIGGRAALVSALGMDFATENPELRTGLDAVLNYADSIGTEGELALFLLAWTVVKVFCFDAGGVVLALASGILFGGVIQGAMISALAATVGSSVAFGLAKLPTPVRKKALEVVEEFPSLRGIEKVVAKDGLKAILTLRLAPVLPIPIGMYNYVYGVTNVPYWQFAGGIFLGSLKPYLLDSYLGVFGKQIVDGTVGGGMMDDALLLVALGFSVLIGVFASQLANETWDSINEEIQLDKAEMASRGGVDGENDHVIREFMGVGLPQWIIGFQLALAEADKRVNALIEDEYHAKVWNCTKEELESPSNDIVDPATLPDSPEVLGANKGFDFGASLCDGLVLSPALFGAFLKYADPLYIEETKTLEESNGVSSKQLPTESTAILESRKSLMQVEPGGEKESIASLRPMTAVELVNENEGPQLAQHTTEIDSILLTLSALRARLQEQLDRL